MSEPRIVCWFSCGVTSALAAKMTLDKYPQRDVHIVYCDTHAEHADNRRFLHDCEQWYGQEIEIICSDTYYDPWDVWDSTRWLKGPKGVRCSIELKVIPRKKYQRPDDLHIFGMDYGETKRAAGFVRQNHDIDIELPLIAARIDKPEAGSRLIESGVRPSAVYDLLPNANCIGCPHGQQGYWNRIRIEYPVIFKRMSRLERRLDAAINKTYAGEKDSEGKSTRSRIFLDELDPDAGDINIEAPFSCGIGCGVQPELFDEVQENT